MSRLDDIEDRYESATDGPWRMRDERGIEFLTGTGTDLLVVSANHADEAEIIAACHDGKAAAWHGETTDAEFIAHARTDVPDLVKFAREVEGALLHGEDILAHGAAIGADFPNMVEILRASFDRFNEGAQLRSSNRGEPASD